MKKVLLLILGVAAISWAGLRLAHNHNLNTSQTEDMSVDRVAVNVADVQVKKAVRSLVFTGITRPVQQLEISAETAGKIASLDFKLGQFVDRGDVIATIDDKLSSLSCATARATSERVAKEYERTKRLYDGGLASQQEYDNALESYETASNSLQEAEKQLSYTHIASSIRGIITSKNIEEGTYVNPGTAIASVANLSGLKVQSSVSEADAYSLAVGMPVTVSTDVYPGVEFQGSISFVSPIGDDVHNYSVEAEMPNSGEHELKSGTFVAVRVTLASSDEGLYIPREALQGSIKDAKVYIVEDGMAKLRRLVIGRETDGILRVLSGLTASDRVIVSGQVNLTDNLAVTVIENR